MHTFFINTSGKKIENCIDILEIQQETMKLVSLDCPISTWQSEKDGYKSCVCKMEELIDNYKDINNSFNLIIYVDLILFEEYTAIPISEHRERDACLRAIYALFTNYMRETIMNALDGCGRNPQEVLIVFEENRKPDDDTSNDDDGRAMIRANIMNFIGLPSMERMEQARVKAAQEAEKDQAAAFVRQIKEILGRQLIDGVFDCYEELIKVWAEEVKAYGAVELPTKYLAERIMERSKDSENIDFVSFVTNRRAGSTNKQEYAKRDLRLYFYLLDCVQDQTIYELRSDGSDRDNPTVKPFPDIDWNQVVSAFEAKRSIYERKYKETVSLSDRYTKLKLAPELYAFDHDRFGLDEFGKKRKKFEIVDVKPNSTSEENDSQEETDGTILPEADKKAVVISEAEASSLFSSDEYKCFPYRGEKGAAEGIKANTPPEKMISEAQKLREHHIHYLKKLKIHISDILSNYAGRSVENDPALLQKRRVSIGDEDFEDASKEYRYAKVGRPAEEKKLKAVKDISDSAYETAMLEYLRFSAGRSVAVTDIEEQCDWFVTRIHQITESLRKIRTVAVGLFAAIFVIYIPFVVIQWEAITENFLTLITALASVGVPVVLLYVVFTAAAIMQRKKYLEAWREFEAQSDQVLLDNSIAAEKYDKLLHTFIPSLRWIYEYRLDVEFYSSCCKMARAKLNHHIQKLHDRVTAVGNILEDLEYKTSPEKYEGVTFDEIDYNVSFCTGDNNCNFYSIIDQHILDMIMK